MDVCPFAMVRVNEVTPASAVVGDTRTRDGSLLVTVTVTPPCCEAPSVAELDIHQPGGHGRAARDIG